MVQILVLCSWFVVLTRGAALSLKLGHSSNNIQQPTQGGGSAAADAVERSQIMLRTYLSPEGSGEFVSMFYPGYKLFAANLLRAKPIIVLDKGTNLSKAYADFAEAPDVALAVSDHTADGLVHGGYDLQQLDTFYLDTWAPEAAEFIVVVDSDAWYYSIPTAETMFDLDGRPHVIGTSTYPSGASLYGNGTNHFLLVEEPAHFMLQFPMIIRRSTLSNLRAHVERLHGKPFLDAFRQLHKRAPYSQFNIILTYAWYNERSQYSWHFQDMPDKVGPVPALQYHDLSMRQMFHAKQFSCGIAANTTFDACSVYFGNASIDERTRHRDSLFIWHGSPVGINRWTTVEMAQSREALFGSYLSSVGRALEQKQEQEQQEVLSRCQRFAYYLTGCCDSSKPQKKKNHPKVRHHPGLRKRNKAGGEARSGS